MISRSGVAYGMEGSVKSQQANLAFRSDGNCLVCAFYRKPADVLFSVLRGNSGDGRLRQFCFGFSNSVSTKLLKKGTGTGSAGLNK